tara:strand:+ start:391 stop:762 length:372 start_codon:yes stop_codon:yes gene_type:complete
MGYRSQVVLLFDKSILPKFLDIVARCEDTKRLVFEWRESWDKDFTISDYGYEEVDCEGHHCIIWDNIKWYADKDTMNIEQFVIDNPDNARFLRAGENGSDTEDLGCFADNDVQVQTYSEIEFF